MNDNRNSHPTSGDLGGGASAGPIGDGFTLPDADLIASELVRTLPLHRQFHHNEVPSQCEAQQLR